MLANVKTAKNQPRVRAVFWLLFLIALNTGIVSNAEMIREMMGNTTSII